MKQVIITASFAMLVLGISSCQKTDLQSPTVAKPSETNNSNHISRRGVYPAYNDASEDCECGEGSCLGPIIVTGSRDLILNTLENGNPTTIKTLFGNSDASHIFPNTLLGDPNFMELVMSGNAYSKLLKKGNKADVYLFGKVSELTTANSEFIVPINK